MKNIAIFASGEGTNAQNIINHFKTSSEVKVCLVLSNNKNANVLKRASNSGVETLLINKDSFYNSEEVIKVLKEHKINLIVLAGFLWLIPKKLIAEFPNKIINIHPSLLPKFGGKGMYGAYVHEAVIKTKEQDSGITIHMVNEEYDKGKIILQEKCSVTKQDTAESLAEKIHQLEMKYFPATIEKILKSA